MVVEQAAVQDAAEILALQKLAYQSEAELYDDYTIPPLTQTLDEIEAAFDWQLFLKATVEGRIIGSVRAHAKEGTCYIGRLIVHPDCQNQGIGTGLMREIENRFEQAKRYELFTGDRSERNLYLYSKLGYKPFRQETLTNRVVLVFMEKPGRGCETIST